MTWISTNKRKRFTSSASVFKHFSSANLLRAHSPSVQFLLSIMLPLQCFPPFLGGGAWHSRLRQCVHSVPQADHLAHSVQPPSTATRGSRVVKANVNVQNLILRFDFENQHLKGGNISPMTERISESNLALGAKRPNWEIFLTFQCVTLSAQLHS